MEAALQVLVMLWGVLLLVAVVGVAADNEQGERVDWKAVGQNVRAAIAKVPGVSRLLPGASSLANSDLRSVTMAIRVDWQDVQAVLERIAVALERIANSLSDPSDSADLKQLTEQVKAGSKKLGEAIPPT